MGFQKNLTLGFAYDGVDERTIGVVQQPMCRIDYNATVQPNFELYLVPGTIFACISVLLNVAVFLTFKHIRTVSALPSPSRSAIHFAILAVLNVSVGVAFVVAQIHAMSYQSYDDLYLSYARQPICLENKTHHLNLFFTVFETSRRSGRLIKGYSILRYFFELMDRFGNGYLAMDRTLIVCFPMTYGLRKQRSSNATTAREFAAWVILPPVFFTFGIVVLLGLTRVLECIYEVFFLLILVLELPLLPLCLCAIVLLVKSCLGRDDNPPTVREGIRNLSQVTLALAVVFIVGDIPNLVFQVGLWAGIRRISDSTAPSYFFFNHVQHVARMISCFFHFFIYFSMSEVFRTNLKAMLKRYFCCITADSKSLDTSSTIVT